jgi:hypothetical protein
MNTFSPLNTLEMNKHCNFIFSRIHLVFKAQVFSSSRRKQTMSLLGAETQALQQPFHSVLK